MTGWVRSNHAVVEPLNSKARDRNEYNFVSVVCQLHDELDDGV